jgi:putative colanic acid biosynthesis acetyltransferase WcaB
VSAVFQDWKANAGNPKIQLALAGFRLAQICGGGSKLRFWLTSPYLVLYRIVVEWLLGIELHWNLEIGPGLRIYHGYALVLHPETRLGRDCILRHGTTTGLREAAPGESSGAPVLGDRVNVGPGCMLLGPIRVGDDAVIGAGSVVTRDVPAGATVAGNPARVIGAEAGNGPEPAGS